MRKTLSISVSVLCCAALFLVASCKKDVPPPAEPAAAPETPKAQPAAKPAAATPAAAATGAPTLEAAKAMLSEFLKPGADHAALSKKLQPTSADYAAVFASPEMAKKAEQVYAGLWKMIDKMPVAPKPGQTELLLSMATTDELKSGAEASKEFPGGYGTAAAHLKPGLTVFRWKFVKPGEQIGMAFDGLYNIGGRWVLMPKPWRITR